jgi:hypothetical protein
MSDERETRARYEWLSTVMLKFLVFVAFAFVLYEAMVGLKTQALSPGRAWVTVAGMGGLLLLLGIDRLITLRVSPSGVEAMLTEVQAHALERVGVLDDPQVAEAARKQILQAKGPDQVEAAMALAVELNVTRVVEQVQKAIRDRLKCYVRYKPTLESPVRTYYAAPLDIKPGETPATQASDYLWVHSYEHDSTLSLRLNRVMGVELSEEHFDPAELMAEWEDEEQDWNVSREW